MERAVKGTVERFGRLNVLVNNAGVVNASTVEGISEEDWDRLMTVNVKGPFLMARAVLPEFRKSGGGVIVNIGSVLGLFAVKDRAAYCASKGGVTMLTKAMALDHAHENVRVNCICPSIVETEMLKGVFDESERGQAWLKARLATIPLGRIGKPSGCGGNGGVSGVGGIVVDDGGGDSVGWGGFGVLSFRFVVISY